MNDYYLMKTSHDLTAQRLAEADRSRLARASRDATKARRTPQSDARTRRPGQAVSSLLHRVAFF